MSDRKRTYRMRQRAESQEATRLRITESAIALHGTLGPSQTTMAAVADHAGVQRSTLYRHFRDEAALFEACSTHWYSLHPPPDFDSWRDIADPEERLVRGLTALYAWYRETGTMLDRLLRDEHLVPNVGARFAAFHGRLAAAQEILAAGRGYRGRRATRMHAAIALALAFETWRTLCREGGLADGDAVALAQALVDAA